MTARPQDDRDQRSTTPAETPSPANAESFPVTGASPPPPAVPSASLSGVPAELMAHPTYEVLKELGRGGMGVVYLARNKVMNRLEVLKVLQDRLTGEPGLLQRFTKEIQMVARLVHANIVVAYGAFPAGEALVLAMEHVEGKNLAEVVRRHGRLSVAHACAFARMAALGLQRAHEEGMVHRDIKPANLMLNKRGEIKVLDFGLAKIASEAADTGLTGTGLTMGTPEYMAPEQALDAKSADIRADIYSLGCTLYFLLTGRSPFAGKSPYEVMHAHQTQPVPPLPGSVPAGLVELVGRMLAKRPEDRPQAPGTVAKALVPFCRAAAAPGPAKPVVVTPRPASRAVVIPPAPPPPPRKAPAPARRRQQSAWLGPLLAGVVVALAILAALWIGGVIVPRVKGDKKPPPKGEDKKELTASLTNSVGMKLVLVPKGGFAIPPQGLEMPRQEDEGRRAVVLTQPFYLGAHEVTQGEYAAVMQGVAGVNARPSYFQKGGRSAPAVDGLDTDRFPVEGVSWEDAARFCRRLTERDREAGAIRPDQEYRLPTEAEWEYACRGGAGSYQTFHVGNALSSKQANFDGNFPEGGADKAPYLQRPAAVGSYPPNAFGLHDMHGNVWEWCADWYDEDSYKAGPFPRVDPLGPPQGDRRVIRGGSWFGSARLCRSAHRDGISPTFKSDNLGLRVVLGQLRRAE